MASLLVRAAIICHLSTLSQTSVKVSFSPLQNVIAASWEQSPTFATRRPVPASASKGSTATSATSVPTERSQTSPSASRVNIKVYFNSLHFANFCLLSGSTRYAHPIPCGPSACDFGATCSKVAGQKQCMCEIDCRNPLYYREVR